MPILDFSKLTLVTHIGTFVPHLCRSVLLGGRIIRSNRVTASHIFSIYKPGEKSY
jgi:hypothetical protein